MKEIATSLRLAVGKARNRQLEVRQRTTRRCGKSSQLHPRVFRAVGEKLVLSGCWIRGVNQSQRAKELEPHLGIRVAGHLRELPSQHGRLRQVGFGQANCVFADTRYGIVERLCY